MNQEERLKFKQQARDCRRVRVDLRKLLAGETVPLTVVDHINGCWGCRAGIRKKIRDNPDTTYNQETLATLGIRLEG